MSPALIGSYFGFGRSSTQSQGPVAVDDSKSPVRALPSNWYTSQKFYELERRAIFSRKWQLITHKNRLANPGDWLKFDTAGWSFIISRDRNDNINAFHNVCRHRAYPVCTSNGGNSRILSCKYHGWSYAMNGKLSKAPGYQELEGFDKEQNGLFKIHSRVDNVGFIWINLDAKETPEVSWEADFVGVDQQERYKQFNFDDYVFDHTWQMDGEYNWKILSDNYNECYHCTNCHPTIGALADLQAYSVNTEGDVVYHNPATSDEMRKNGMVVAASYYFPNVSTNISPHFFMIQRFVPSGAKTCSMQYQVFRNKNSTEEQFKVVDGLYKQIMSEDKALCDQAQKNLNAGIFVNGELHPRLEKGPLHFQKTVRDNVMSHRKREQAAKKEIWPARQQLPSKPCSKQTQADIDFCDDLLHERADSAVDSSSSEYDF